jgi:hypothetical protein
MSLFGSREEDPLLENDPLAPSSDSEAVHEEDASSIEEDDDAESTSSSASAPEMDPPGALSSDGAESDSVFRVTSPHSVSSEENELQFDSREDTRVVVHTAEEAGAGRLTVLNAALEEGWRLDRVELRSESPDEAGLEEEGAQSSIVTLAFVLQKNAA